MVTAILFSEDFHFFIWAIEVSSFLYSKYLFYSVSELLIFNSGRRLSFFPSKVSLKYRKMIDSSINLSTSSSALIFYKKYLMSEKKAVLFWFICSRYKVLLITAITAFIEERRSWVDHRVVLVIV